MLKHALLGSVLAALTADLAFAQARSLPGRQLDIIADPIGTRFVPSIGADATLSPIRGIFWDERCASVEYTFNTNQGANEGTADRIGPNVLANIVQRGPRSKSLEQYPNSIY